MAFKAVTLTTKMKMCRAIAKRNGQLFSKVTSFVSPDGIETIKAKVMFIKHLKNPPKSGKNNNF